MVGVRGWYCAGRLAYGICVVGWVCGGGVVCVRLELGVWICGWCEV